MFVDMAQMRHHRCFVQAMRYTLSMTILSDKIQQTIAQHQLFDSDNVLVLMVSGGGDSVAMAHLISSGEIGHYSRVVIVHINHGLRGVESDADQRSVEDLARTLGVPCECQYFDVANIAREQHLNLEDAGRTVRYQYAHQVLETYCSQWGVDFSKGRILTAHSLDDRIETFFSRALFGSGLGALSSIQSKRDNIVRPLISCTREELRSFLESSGHTWREDESNLDISRTRAAIRHTLVPAAESINPAFRDALERTLNLLADDEEILGKLASSFANDFVDDFVRGGHVTFNVPLMRTLEFPMARRVIRHGLLSAFSEASRIDHAHIDELTQALASVSFVRDLPFGLRAQRKCDTLKISKRMQPLMCQDVLLEEPGVTALGACGSIEVSEVDSAHISRDANCATIDADALIATLGAGPVREGERIVPLGMTGSKKLSDIFIDAKIERDERLGIPIVRDGSKPIWVAGLVVSDEYKITGDTKHAYAIRWIHDDHKSDDEGIS